MQECTLHKIRMKTQLEVQWKCKIALTRKKRMKVWLEVQERNPQKKRIKAWLEMQEVVVREVVSRWLELSRSMSWGRSQPT